MVVLALPEQAGSMKKNVGQEGVVWSQGSFHQVHAAGKALHCMGLVHTPLLGQLQCTLHLHQPHTLLTHTMSICASVMRDVSKSPESRMAKTISVEG